MGKVIIWSMLLLIISNKTSIFNEQTRHLRTKHVELGLIGVAQSEIISTNFEIISIPVLEEKIRVQIRSTPDIGSFFGVDPISEDFYTISTYQVSHNNPVWKIALEGLEDKVTSDTDISSSAGNNRDRSTQKKVEIKSKWLVFRAGSPWQWSHSARVVTNRFANRAPTSDGTSQYIVLKQNGPVQSNGNINRGSERGAFKHTLWQSIITDEFSVSDAQLVGNTHAICAVDTSKTEGIKNIFTADQATDELNNEIGREFGSGEGKGLNNKQKAIGVLDIFKSEGLYTFKKNKDGTFTITKSKITEKQYSQLKKRWENLTNDGEDADTPASFGF